MDIIIILTALCIHLDFGLLGIGEPMYRCNDGTEVLTLDRLCDGNADCIPSGDDETNALCDS